MRVGSSVREGLSDRRGWPSSEEGDESSDSTLTEDRLSELGAPVCVARMRAESSLQRSGWILLTRRCWTHFRARPSHRPAVVKEWVSRAGERWDGVELGHWLGEGRVERACVCLGLSWRAIDVSRPPRHRGGWLVLDQLTKAGKGGNDYRRWRW